MENKIRSWSDRNSLNNFLESSPPAIVVGGGAESPNKFLSILVDDVNIGIILSDFGIAPSVVCYSEDLIFVGHDQGVTIVNKSLKKAVKTILLEGVFFEFLSLGIKNMTLVVHELGIVLFDGSGKTVFKAQAPDIVESWRVVENQVFIKSHGEGKEAAFILPV